MSGPDIARRLVKKFSGPAATVYSCPFCKEHIIVKRLPRFMAGRIGRGFGLRTGGAAHSQMGKHIRKAHPEKL